MPPRPVSKHGARRPPPVHAPLSPVKVQEQVCLELDDNSSSRTSAVDLFALHGVRDAHVPAGRLCEQFVRQNTSLLRALDVRLDVVYNGRDVALEAHAGNTVGAIPLFSPAHGQMDYGLVVKPRFPWLGIGQMLSLMGWRVTPTPLRLPLLHRSERRVPPWVLSSMVLMRVKALLDSLDRRFETVSEDRSAPRGTVDWERYAIARLPSAKFLSVPCSFPDLRDDRLLQGAIRYTLERQLRSLETQRHHGAFVHRLIDMAEHLSRRVRTVAPHVPSRTDMAQWAQRPMRTTAFVDGMRAIEWTVEERGLAGLSDLEGLPWSLPMEAFFEAWLETVLTAVASRTGGQLKSGRNRQTVHPISWDPPYLGSQKALIPDLWIEYPDLTVILDAKYKRHWEELQQHNWHDLAGELRERHRNDLLQVLSYVNLVRTPAAVACLAYPCLPQTWESLRLRNRLFHRARLAVGSRSIHLWLTALPMSGPAETMAAPLAEEIRRIHGTIV